MTMEVTYKIAGLDCPNCTARVEKVMKKVKGVKDANINFMTGKVVIKISGNESDVLPALEAAVKKAEPKVTFERK